MKTMINLALKKYIETLQLKNYSASTIKNYRNHFLPFLNYHSGKRPSQIKKNEIVDYLLDLRNKKTLSASEQNQIINAIKFFYEKVLNHPKEIYDIPRAKKPFSAAGNIFCRRSKKNS